MRVYTRTAEVSMNEFDDQRSFLVNGGGGTRRPGTRTAVIDYVSGMAKTYRYSVGTGKGKGRSLYIYLGNTYIYIYTCMYVCI